MQLHPNRTAADTSEVTLPTARVTARQPRSPLRRRLLWACAALGIVSLLIFTPPLINANHYQRQIARSMSESLGRPVHLDNVSFHLLPVPGLTLSNLVVSEDPAFGAEPTIRANTVEATLRLSSLWRRKVEFSTVRFVEPSVNLVRNRQGRWNLANVLLRASHVETAPTAQRRAGPAPRFPYIEATGGRVNIKLDEEKLPFSLTDADFALWLPSPNHWRVRLQGQPARTDTNLTDPGVFRLAGDLQRAGATGDVPVDLRASWHDAPLGEASRMLTADDMGWRGTLNLDASLTGTLNAAELHSKLTLGGLRRADFAAAHPFDLQITCGSGLSVATVSLQQLRCTMPDDAPEPMLLESPILDLQRPEQAVATLTAEHVPLHWGLLWAALFSARVPTELYPNATADMQLGHVAASTAAITRVAVTDLRSRGKRSRQLVRTAPSEGSGWAAWDGEVVVHLPPAPMLRTAATEAPEAGATEASGGGIPLDLHWHTENADASGGARTAGVPSVSTGRGLTFRLQPITIPLGAGSSLAVTGTVTPAGYTVAVNGTASAPALLLPARYLPQLGDGLDEILPFPPTGSQASRVEFNCSHPWGALQTCTSAHVAPSHSRAGPVVPPLMMPSQVPALLQPHSLSPLDHDPQLGNPQASPQP